MGALVDFLQQYQNSEISNFQLPEEINHRYSVCACLKASESKQVYLARRIADGKKFIIKCSANANGENLQEEYFLHKSLNHKGLVQPVEFLQKDNSSYFVREYVEGNTITELLEMTKNGHLPDSEIIHITIQLCEVLHLLHVQNPPIIHRDIKPDNVIVLKSGEIKLIDFGISRRFINDQEKDTVIMGTVFSAPPEQYGFKQTDARSDIYSLGVLMYYMATGDLDIRELNDFTITGYIKKCIRKCTEFSPNDRFTSTKQLKHFLILENQINKRKKLIQFTSIALLLLTAFLGGYLFTMKYLKDTTNILQTSEMEDRLIYVFQSSLIEEAVREELGKSSTDMITVSDLKQVTQLYLCGQQIYHDWDEHFVYGKEQYMTSAEYSSTGLYQVKGDISSLEDLVLLPNLTTLTLYNQSISDLSSLSGLKNLKKLGLGANQIDDLTPLKSLTELQTLDISGNNIQNDDLTAINKLDNLIRLDLGATKVTSLDNIKHMELQYLSVFDTFVMDCEGLEKMTSLEEFITTGLGNTITEEALQRIVTLYNLKSLNIMGGKYFNLSILSDLPSLTSLDLCGCESVRIEELNSPLISNLSVDCIPDLDLTGVEEHMQPIRLSIRDSNCRDFAPIFKITGLKQLNCNSEQAAEIREQFEEIPFEITMH